MKVIEDLKKTLGQQALRFRTGVIVTDDVDRKSLDATALRLQAFFVDYHAIVCSRLSEGSRVVPIDPLDVLSDLKALAVVEGSSPIALVINLDLALAKLSHGELLQFWEAFSQLEPFAKTALVTVLPTHAVSIQPSREQMHSWKEWGRIAIVEHC